MELKKISKFLIFVLIFFFPLFFFPFFQNVLDFPKFLLLSFLISLSLIFYLAQFFSQEKFKISFHPILFFLFSFLFFSFLSTIFSKSKIQSLFGIPLSISESFLSLLFLSLFLILLMNLFKKEEFFSLSFLFSVSISILIFLSFFQIFGKFIFPFDFSKVRNFNFSGSQNSLSILLASILPFFIISFLNSKKFFKFFYFILIFLSLFFLILVNFKISWLILAFGASILLWILFLEKANSFKNFFFPMFALALVLVFFFFNFQLISFLPEVQLSQKISFEIAKKSFLENLILGTGPATFSLNFSSKKPEILLSDPIFWNLRFSNSASTFLDILSNLGIFGTISFLLLIFSIFFFGFKNKNEYFLTLFLLSLSQFLYPLNLTLQFSFFFFLAAFLKANSKEKEISIKREGFLFFLSSFLSTLIFVLLILNSIFLIQILIGEAYYFKASKEWQRGKIDETIKFLEKAKNINPRFDFYWRNLSQAYLAKANEKIQKGDQNIQNEIFLSIEAAKIAEEKGKFEPLNFANRAFIYQSLIGVAAGAEDWALKSWQEALKLEPKNPYYLTQRGILFLQKRDFEKAKSDFEKAIQLKGDYAPAHFQMGLFYQLKGELEKAISKLEETKFYAPFDAQLAFHLGLAYYQKGDFEKAKAEFERAVALNENYANALYYLGLTYDQLGEKEKALKSFEKVLKLNPEIEFLKKIVENLKAGKRALEGVFQP